MGFLQQLLSYPRICIQCHNNPDADAVASSFGLYRYLTAHGVDAFIVYGGPLPIKKSGMKMLVRECGIPIRHTHDPGPFDLLLLADCQRGQGNVESFPAQHFAVIDHHVPMLEPGENILIKHTYQSCSTIVWELLKEEGYPLENDPELKVALLYGLYTDTSCFADLYSRIDNEMRLELFEDQALFNQLVKSNLTVAELMVASDAMHNHYFDVERRFAIVEALRCDQIVLGIIGDFMIQVDVVSMSFAYTESGAGYRISLRTCHEQLEANRIAAFLCEGIGSGGGHLRKAGGYIQKDRMEAKYGHRPIFDVVNELLCRYIDEHIPT